MTSAETTLEPMVTAIALCYNHSDYIEECLESIRNQSYRNIQLIITDDCSKDNSIDIITKWIETNRMHCVFIKHSRNAGLCKTLNEALSHAKGKYISIIATDDVWLGDKIKNQVKTMEGLPETVGVLYSDAYHIDEHSICKPEMFISSRRKFIQNPSGKIYETLIVGNFIPVMTTLIRASCFTKAGLYDEELVFEDWDMWLRISRFYDFTYHPIISAKYRILSTSLARNMGPGGPETLLKINLKCFQYHDNSDDIINLLRTRIAEYAETLYRLNNDKKNYYLFKSLQCVFSLKTLILFVASVFGIPYSSVIKTKEWILG